MAKRKVLNNAKKGGVPAVNVTDEQMEAVEILRNDPIVAAHELLERKMRPLTLTLYQRWSLRQMWEKQFSYLVWSRGCGKTTMLAIYLILRALLFSGQRCVIVSASYRQAILVMREVERFWQESPHLQASVTGDPTFGTTEAILNFNNGSYIKALPLGDGTKIRGERASTLVVDEYAQVPRDILDTVVRPFLNVTADPMGGRDTQAKNFMVIATTAYYKFSHAYQTYQDYKRLTDPHDTLYDPSYCLSEFSYRDAPEGFMDRKIIAEAKRSMEHSQFLMEYENIWLDDTEGYFPRSLVESARRPWLSPRVQGDPRREYVMGIDPARTRDAFAIVIIELADRGALDHRVVFAHQEFQMTFQDMTATIRNFLRTFHIVRIQMDAGGGGSTIKDLLAVPALHYDERTQTTESEDAILDMDDEDHRYLSGQRILRMVKFAPKIITKMNNDLKAQLQGERIYLPGRISQDGWGDPGWEAEARILKNIDTLIAQTSNIVATPNQTGYYSFDTPTQREHKDLYSAWILALNGVLELRSPQPEAAQLAQGFWMSNSMIRTPAEHLQNPQGNLWNNPYS